MAVLIIKVNFMEPDFMPNKYEDNWGSLLHFLDFDDTEFLSH